MHSKAKRDFEGLSVASIGLLLLAHIAGLFLLAACSGSASPTVPATAADGGASSPTTGGW